MDIKHCCCCWLAKRIGGTRLKSSPLEIAFRSSIRQEIYLSEECNLMKSAPQFSLKIKPNYCFNHCCSHQCTLGRSFQVLDENFAKSCLTSNCGGEFPESRENQFPNYISPLGGRPAGRLQKPIRIPIIIRRWIGETPWLYYASSPLAQQPALSKHGESGREWTPMGAMTPSQF